MAFKSLLLLVVFTFGLRGYAEDIAYTYVDKFNFHKDYFYKYASYDGNYLADYLETSLSCEDVKLCIYEISGDQYRQASGMPRPSREDGLSEYYRHVVGGVTYFKLKLKAHCAESFSDFNFRIYPNPSEIRVGFTQKGEKKQVKLHSGGGTMAYSHDECDGPRFEDTQFLQP